MLLRTGVKPSRWIKPLLLHALSFLPPTDPVNSTAPTLVVKIRYTAAENQPRPVFIRLNVMVFSDTESSI